MELDNIQQSGATQITRKANEDSFLESLRKKGNERRSAQKIAQNRQIQKQKEPDQHTDLKITYKNEFKLVEQIAQILKTEVRKINIDQLRQVLPELRKAEAQAVQRIIETQRLGYIQDKYRQAHRNDIGVRTQFSKEYTLLQDIAKALHLPVEQLTTEQINHYLKLSLKEKGFVPRAVKANTLSRTEPPGKTTHTPEAKVLASLHEQFRDLLAVLRDKQSQIKDVLEKQSGDHLSQKLQLRLIKLETKLNRLEQRVRNSQQKDAAKGSTASRAELNEELNQLDKELQQIQKFSAQQKEPVRPEYTPSDLQKQESFEILSEPASPAQKISENKSESLNENASSDFQEQNALETLPEPTPHTTKKLDNIISQKVEKFKEQIKALQRRETLRGSSPIERAIDSTVKALKRTITQLKTNQLVNREIRGINQRSEAEKNLKLQIENLQQELNDLLDLEKEGTSLSPTSLKQRVLQQKSAPQILSHLNKEYQADRLITSVLHDQKSSIIKTKEELSPFLSLEANQLSPGNVERYSRALQILLNSIENHMATQPEVEALEHKDETASHELQEIMTRLVVVLGQIGNKKYLQEAVTLQRQQMTTSRRLQQTSETALSLIADMSAISQRNKESAKIEALLENLIQKSGDLTDDQSLAHFILSLRSLYLEQLPEFRALLKLLIRRGLLDTKTLEEELGVSIGETSERMQTSVQAECTNTLSKLLGIPFDSLQKNPAIQFFIQKGRIDRQQFEKLIKKKISPSAWDYGLVSFNESSIGKLKERAELNSFQSFWGMMRRMSGSQNDEKTRELAELFLTKESFAPDEHELFTLFLVEYEDRFADPQYPLADLHQTYFSESNFAQLPASQREEVLLAVILRMIQNMKTDNKHLLYEKLLRYTEMSIKTEQFIRSVYILDYYFSHGGHIYPKYLDTSKPFQLIEETPEWDDIQEKAIATHTVSELVKGMSKPVKATPQLKLRSMSDRIKDRIRKA